VQEADLVAAVKALAFEAEAVEGLVADQFREGVRQLDFTASALFVAVEFREDLWRQDVPTNDGHAGRGEVGLRFLDNALHANEAVGFADRVDYAVTPGFFQRDFAHGQHATTRVFIGCDHALKTAWLIDEQFIGKKDGERFIANEVPGTPDGVTQSERVLLSRKTDRTAGGEGFEKALKLGMALT
jgi:hypothetical protein